MKPRKRKPVARGWRRCGARPSPMIRSLARSLGSEALAIRFIKNNNLSKYP